MKLSTPRYSLCLFFQLMFVLCDLIFNCVSLFPRSRDGLLVLFMALEPQICLCLEHFGLVTDYSVATTRFQDLFLVLSITSMLMSLFSTYLFQAGLVEVLVRKFRLTLAGACAYALSSLALHGAWLAARWRHDAAAADTPALLALFTLHRCLSPWYYFLYKRCALRLSDPRFYEDVEWTGRLQPR